MAPTRPRKAPGKLTDRFIDRTLDRLFQIEAQLKRIEKKLDFMCMDKRQD